MMITIRTALLASALMLAASSQALAGKEASLLKPGDRPGLFTTDVKKIKATVTDINYEYMRVRLTDDEGRDVTLIIDPKARNFEQVKKGDKVYVETVEAFAIHVTPQGGKRVNDSITYVHVAKPGEKPHGVAIQTQQVTATVEAIDYVTRTVAMKGPQGNIRTFRVDPVVKRFNEVQKGDQITVKITEAIALSVTSVDASCNQGPGLVRTASSANDCRFP